MGDQSWDISELQHAADLMRQAAQYLNSAGQLLQDPDPQMYGRLVGYAAEHAEPITTQRHRNFLLKLGTSIDGIGDGLAESARDYERIENENVRRAQELMDLINNLGGLR